MKIFTAASLFLITALQAFSQIPYVTTVPYVTGLNQPVVITNCKDSRLFIVEQTGYIRICNSGVLRPTPFLNIDSRVQTSGEQGLLGLAFHPQYKQNGYFYVDYINNSGNTVIARYSVDPADSNLALVNSELILLTINQPYSNHNGGNLLFGKDGYLYIGMGDGGSAGDPQNRAQNPAELLGKILRIDVNHGATYTIPPTNPFINSPAYRPEIWATGMRNPWRFSFDRHKGDLWIGDVGQGTNEEIDYQPVSSTGGENYGWRCYEGNSTYNTATCLGASNYDFPVYQYTHSSGCSITGGFIYRGALFSNLYGHYLFTDYCTPQLRTITVNGPNVTAYTHSTVSGAGISTFGEDQEGELYLADLNTGSVRKIVDTTSCAPVAWLANTDTLDVCDTTYLLHTPANSNFAYQWAFNSTGTSDSTATITVNQSGMYSVLVYNILTSCSNMDSVYINLKGLPDTISWQGVDTAYCSVASDVLLNALPAGGVFYGAGVSDSLFSPANAGLGLHVLLYEVNDSKGCLSRLEKEVNIKNCTALSEVETPAFSIAPNPVTDHLNIFMNKALTVERISITDMTGRTVMLPSFQLVGNGEYSIKTSGLQAGLYSLMLEGEKGIIGLRSFLVAE